MNLGYSIDLIFLDYQFECPYISIFCLTKALARIKRGQYWLISSKAPSLKLCIKMRFSCSKTSGILLHSCACLSWFKSSKSFKPARAWDTESLIQLDLHAKAVGRAEVDFTML